MPGTKITNLDIANFLIHQNKDKRYLMKTPFIANTLIAYVVGSFFTHKFAALKEVDFNSQGEGV